jgi:hypothetical protein
MSNQEPVEESTNDLLEKKLIDKIFVNPIPMQINDVLINLIIGVTFLEKIFPKGRIVFQVPPITNLPPFCMSAFTTP